MVKCRYKKCNIYLTNNVRKIDIDAKRPVYLFIDYAKAFDKVKHNELLSKWMQAQVSEIEREYNSLQIMLRTCKDRKMWKSMVTCVLREHDNKRERERDLW